MKSSSSEFYNPPRLEDFEEFFAQLASNPSRGLERTQRKLLFTALIHAAQVKEHLDLKDNPRIMRLTVLVDSYFAGCAAWQDKNSHLHKNATAGFLLHVPRQLKKKHIQADLEKKLQAEYNELIHNLPCLQQLCARLRKAQTATTRLLFLLCIRYPCETYYQARSICNEEYKTKPRPDYWRVAASYYLFLYYNYNYQHHLSSARRGRRQAINHIKEKPQPKETNATSLRGHANKVPAAKEPSYGQPGINVFTTKISETHATTLKRFSGIMSIT